MACGRSGGSFAGGVILFGLCAWCSENKWLYQGHREVDCGFLGRRLQIIFRSTFWYTPQCCVRYTINSPAASMAYTPKRCCARQSNNSRLQATDFSLRPVNAKLQATTKPHPRRLTHGVSLSAHGLVAPETRPRQQQRQKRRRRQHNIDTPYHPIPNGTGPQKRGGPPYTKRGKGAQQFSATNITCRRKKMPNQRTKTFKSRPVFEATCARNCDGGGVSS